MINALNAAESGAFSKPSLFQDVKRFQQAKPFPDCIHLWSSIFVVTLNKNFLQLASQKVQTPAAVNAMVLSILLCKKYSIQLLEYQKHHQFQLRVDHKHLTIRLFNHGLSQVFFKVF